MRLHEVALHVALLAGLNGCVASAPQAVTAPAPESDAAVDAAAQTPEKWSNTIRWATASEVENLGYNVYRGVHEDGPWSRLNAELIPGAGTTDEPNRYRFVDETVDPHRIYYYWVESVSIDGVRERFTPVARVGPKVPPASSP